MNQNLGMPNDLLGRCCVLMPMHHLTVADPEGNLDLDLPLEFGPGTLSIRFDTHREDTEAIAMKLKKSLVEVTGGLSTVFSSKRLHEKLEVEDLQEQAVKRLVNVVAAGELDLEELYEKNGTGGGKGTCAAQCRLRAVTRA